ncbi:MAG: PepSY-like domain-containing protein [Bacteroidia bacterium]
MKKLILFLPAFLTILSASAQKISPDIVPTVVVDAYKAKFSIAEKTTWEIDYDKYEANFSVGKTEFSAYFDKDGKWLQTSTYIKPSELPKNILKEIQKKYGELSAYKMESAEKVEKEKETTYKIEVLKGESTFVLEYAENGDLLADDKKDDSQRD